jgi:hypothetical protein
MKSEIVLLGSSSECKIQLVSQSVSRFHCSLLRTPTGLWVVDLLGKGGTFVKGTRVRFSRLELGADLTLGDFRVRPVTISNSGPRMVALPNAVTAADAGPAVPESGQPPALVAVQLPGPMSLSHKNTCPQPATETPLAQILSGTPSLESYAPDQIALLEAVLAPLAKQFSDAQQQLLAQLNSVMDSVFHMVATLQREQMELVNQELAQIRALSSELLALQNGAIAPKHALESGRANGLGPYNGQQSRSDSSFSLAVQNMATGGDQVQGSDAFVPPTPLNFESTDVAQPSEIHALICRRISEIEIERQGHWQKIVSFLRRNASQVSTEMAENN